MRPLMKLFEIGARFKCSAPFDVSVGDEVTFGPSRMHNTWYPFKARVIWADKRPGGGVTDIEVQVVTER